MRTIKTLVIPFAEIPFEGLELDSTDTFLSLHRPDDDPEDPELNEVFKNPIHLRGRLMPVGAKVDVRGEFETQVEEICDRCAVNYSSTVHGSISTFLMPAKQFSKHDKPGGKVIHPPMREQKKSRHHSRSKAPVLTDAEGEHEDVSFGAFNGETVDLRGLLREQLILSLPLSRVCSESCKGLCFTCGANLSLAPCNCQPAIVEEPLTPLQQALKQKFSVGIKG